MAHFDETSQEKVTCVKNESNNYVLIRIEIDNFQGEKITISSTSDKSITIFGEYIQHWQYLIFRYWGQMFSIMIYNMNDGIKCVISCHVLWLLYYLEVALYKLKMQTCFNALLSKLFV